MAFWCPVLDRVQDFSQLLVLLLRVNTLETYSPSNIWIQLAKVYLDEYLLNAILCEFSKPFHVKVCLKAICIWLVACCFYLCIFYYFKIRFRQCIHTHAHMFHICVSLHNTYNFQWFWLAWQGYFKHCSQMLALDKFS